MTGRSIAAQRGASRRGRCALSLAVIWALTACTTQPLQQARQEAQVAPVPRPSGEAGRSAPPVPVRPVRPNAPAPVNGPAPVTVSGSRRLPLVALTFDSNLTAHMQHELDRRVVRSFDNTAVVDELMAMRVPATFFLSGLWVQRYPAEVRRLARVSFFELGSHSYAHVGFAPHCYRLGLLPAARMFDDISRSEQVLHQLDPTATRLFRFPGGCYNRDALRAAALAHVQVIQYDVASGDAFGTSVRHIVQHTVATTRNGSIIVMHVTGGNMAPLTAAALPAVIAGLRARGFRFVTVTQLLRAQTG